jgi:mRNA interferase MazF
VTVNGLSHKAMANQLTTISKARAANRMGRLSVQDLLKVEEAILL